VGIYWRRPGTSLAIYDESIYVSIARLTADQGYVPFPYVQGGLGATELYPFLEKPPLVTRLAAVSIEVLGPTEEAM